LDVGHGRCSFSWRVMESAMKQSVPPGTISSDVHQFNVAGPVFDLATTLSKFLHLGMPLEQVIERATINPAKTFRFPHSPGTVRVGPWLMWRCSRSSKATSSLQNQPRIPALPRRESAIASFSRLPR